MWISNTATTLMMLPIVLTWVQLKDLDKFRARQQARVELGDRLWRRLAIFATPQAAKATMLASQRSL